MNLSGCVKVTRVVNATAVGTANVVGSTIDMADYEGVVFIAQFGTITDGTPTLKAGGGAASDGSDAADLAATGIKPAITDDNKCALLDLYRPTQRYITPTVVRAGATGAVLDSVIAIQYGPKKMPTTNDATVAKSGIVISPAVGTA